MWIYLLIVILLIFCDTFFKSIFCDTFSKSIFCDTFSKSIFCDTFSKSIKQVGGDRKAIFSRFHYMPEYTFMSSFDMNDPNRFSKHYNTPGPLKIIVRQPYRFYTMLDGNWGYPWHFPRPKLPQCLKLASDLCDEKIDWDSDIIKPSKCYDGVYKQCKNGIDPLFIKVEDKNVYDFNYQPAY